MSAAEAEEDSVSLNPKALFSPVRAMRYRGRFDGIWKKELNLALPLHAIAQSVYLLHHIG